MLNTASEALTSSKRARWPGVATSQALTPATPGACEDSPDTYKEVRLTKLQAGTSRKEGRGLNTKILLRTSVL